MDVYEHLLGDGAYFRPVVDLEVAYEVKAEDDEVRVAPVFMGNLMKPRDVSFNYFT